MNPQGHPLSGWNTFSAYEEEGCVVAQVQEQSRSSDPLYEMFFRFFGSSGQQDRIWIHVLNSLADYLGVKGQVVVSKTLIDPQVQWSQAKNIWQNAAIRTVFYAIAAPLRWLRKPFDRKKTQMSADELPAARRRTSSRRQPRSDRSRRPGPDPSPDSPSRMSRRMRSTLMSKGASWWGHCRDSDSSGRRLTRYG